MKISLHTFVWMGFFGATQAACGANGGAENAASSEGAIVEEVSDDAPIETSLEPDDLLGPDPEPMIADDEIDRAAARPEDVQDAEAGLELDQEGAIELRVTAAPQPATRCKKRIHVTFAVYTYLTENLGSNGCWVADRTVQDTSFRDCHSDGSIKNPHGDKWFYDDTNPYNDLGRERATVQRCSAGEIRGFEYMAFREGRWRLVTRPHTSAYFAELYTDDAHLDNLYYVSGVYRGNAALRRNARVAPMLNFAPYPDTTSQRRIGAEVLKVCKTLHNRAYLGLYEWHYPLPAGSPRVKTIANALNACTKKR